MNLSTDGKSPGFWFYTADYERDMQILSLAAQGLWTRMLCWMHENEAHRGFLELPTGAPMNSWDIGAKVGKPIREIERCITEMERVGIFSRDTRGCIYSRRMARDIHISTVRRNAANSRHETAKRAADGKFAGDFAGAKQSSKTMQNPSVTASVSVSDSVSTVRENTHNSSVPAPGPDPPSCVRVMPSPPKIPSLKFEEWWLLWSRVRGTNHRFAAEHAYWQHVTEDLASTCMACTESYLASLENPGKGYNPENFLADQARDRFTARWPARASPKPHQHEYSPAVREALELSRKAVNGNPN